jgi:hypothetical protein
MHSADGLDEYVEGRQINTSAGEDSVVMASPARTGKTRLEMQAKLAGFLTQYEALAAEKSS